MLITSLRKLSVFDRIELHVQQDHMSDIGFGLFSKR